MAKEKATKKEKTVKVKVVVSQDFVFAGTEKEVKGFVKAFKVDALSSPLEAEGATKTSKVKFTIVK